MIACLNCPSGETQTGGGYSCTCTGATNWWDGSTCVICNPPNQWCPSLLTCSPTPTPPGC